MLTLTVVALVGIGAGIERGVESGSAVVNQAIGLTAVAAPALPTPAAAASAPEPLATPAPAAVATPPALPAAPAQPLAAEVRWLLLAEERFDSFSESWPEVRSPSWSSTYQDGGYMLQVDSRPGISYSRPLRSHDFWLGADVRIVRGQAGLFFLIGRPNDFYRFLIDTDGRFQLEWQQVGVSKPLIAWTASDALRRGEGQTNRISVRRSGDELAFYANGMLLTTYPLPPGNRLESRIGLALDAPDGGRTGQAWFDNLLAHKEKDL